MRVVFRGLQPDRRYHFRVVARVAAGNAEQASDDFVLDTTRPRVDDIKFGELLLTVRNTAGVARRAWPVTSGVPLPKGHLASTDNLRLIEEIGPLRVCVRVAGKYLADNGATLFDYEVRIHAYAGSSRVRINHNYTCRLKERTDPSEGRTRPDGCVVRIETMPTISDAVPTE